LVYSLIIELIHYSTDTHTRIHANRQTRVITNNNKTMKFEANIPSYLRTGAGVFPVKEKAAPKRVESTNFYEMAKQGFDMPVANESNRPAFAPVGDFKREEPMDAENFLDKMQDNMEKQPPVLNIRPNMEPKSDINLDAEPVMPSLPLEKVTPPTEMVAEADGEDVFIG